CSSTSRSARPRRRRPTPRATRTSQARTREARAPPARCRRRRDDFTHGCRSRHAFVTRGADDARVQVAQGTQPTHKRGRTALAIAGGALAAALLAALVSHADPAATWAAVRSAGPLAVTALVPFAFGLTADACGLLALVQGLGHRVRLSQVLPVRLASEALHLSMPAGFVASDTATAIMLESRCGVP